MERYFGPLAIVLLLGMVVTRFEDEKTGNSRHELRENRPEGLPDPALCPFLFLSHLCRRIQPPHSQLAAVLPFGSTRLAGSPFLPGRAVAAFMEPGFFREKFSGRHRYGTSRSPGHRRSFCLQPQSHLRGLRPHPARPIPAILQLDPSGIPGRRRLVVPPPGLIGRSIFEEALRITAGASAGISEQMA